MNEPTIPFDAGRRQAVTVSDRVHELLNATPEDMPVAWKMSDRRVFDAPDGVARPR